MWEGWIKERTARGRTDLEEDRHGVRRGARLHRGNRAALTRSEMIGFMSFTSHVSPAQSLFFIPLLFPGTDVTSSGAGIMTRLGNELQWEESDSHVFHSFFHSRNLPLVKKEKKTVFASWS